MGHGTANVFLAPPPRALGKGKRPNIIKFQLQSKFQRFCDLTIDIYKTYQMGFSLCRLCHAIGVGLGGTQGPKLYSACPTIIVFPPKPLDQIQPNLVCEFLTCIGRATQFFAPPLVALGRGQKVKYH